MLGQIGSASRSAWRRTAGDLYISFDIVFSLQIGSSVYWLPCCFEFVCVWFDSYNNKIWKMFDSEDSDSSVDDETLAWIDQYPDLELNARTFRHLQRGAVASVPDCITREEDVAAHAKDTLAKILTMCSREEVDLIRNVDNATELISQKQLILEQAERLEREQKKPRVNSADKVRELENKVDRLGQST